MKNKNKQSQKSDREIYLENRNNIIEDFDHAIDEVKRKNPSVKGTICSFNFKDFSMHKIFYTIKEQEEYIKDTEKFKMNYVVLEEEQQILKDMIEKAKKLFGNQFSKKYNELYKH